MTGLRRTFASMLLLIAAAGGCSNHVNVGSSLLWLAEHETGNFTEWTAGSKGGYSADAPGTSAVISTDVAHSGTHSVKLTNGAPAAQVNGAPPPYETALLWPQDDFPEEAYYGAWYYLPQAYQTTVDWRIMEFQAPGTGDGGTNGLLIDVDLRSLADGDLIIDIFDHRAAYLRSPTAEPALPVPIAQWFQIEVFYRNVGDDTGRFTLCSTGGSITTPRDRSGSAAQPTGHPVAPQKVFHPHDPTSMSTMRPSAWYALGRPALCNAVRRSLRKAKGA